MKNLKVLSRSIALLLILITISSCVTERKAKRWAYEHKEVLATWCLDCFETTLKPIYIKGDEVVVTDTITDSVITVITVDCPDGTKVSKDCPPGKIVTVNKLRVDTLLKDTWQTTAKVFILQSRSDSLSNELIKLGIKYESVKESRDTWRKFSLWGLLLIGVYVLLKVKRVF